MATKKTATRSATRSAKTAETAEYRAEIALRNARLSGSATKADTARNGGVYTVRNRKNGASYFLRGIFAGYFPKKETVPAEDFRGALSSVFSGKNPEADKVVSGFLSDYEKESGKPFGNIKTLTRRLSSDIRKGFVLSFALSTEEPR